MLFLSNAALQAMAFAYRIALGKCVPASALGLNSLMMQLYSVVVSFSISGLNIAVTGLAARTEANGIKPLLFSALRSFFVLWAMLAAPVAIFSGSVCKAALGSENAFPALLVMLLCILMTGVENMLKSVHFGRKLVKECAVSELTEQAVRFTLVIILIKKLGGGSDEGSVFLIMLGMAGSEFVSIGLLSGSFIRRFGKGKSSNQTGIVRDIARVAFPAALTALSAELFEAVGSLLLPGLLATFGLSRAAALSEIGVISTLAIPFTLLPMSFIGALAVVVMPQTAEQSSRGGSPVSLIRKALLATAAVGVVSAAIMLVFSGSVSGGLLGKSFDKTVFILLVIRALTAQLGVICTAILNGLFRQKTVLAISVTGEAYRLIMILLLSPVLGMRGYALGMLLGGLLRAALALLAVSSAAKMGMEKSRSVC